MIQRLKALLFYAALIFVGGTIFSFIAVNILLKPSPSTESPELVAAKTAAQISELARNQESNIFWGHFFQAIAIGFALTLLLGGWMIGAMIWRGFNHKIWMDQANYHRSINLLEADQLGNYPIPKINGQFFQFDSGNPAFANPIQPMGLLPEPSTRTNRQMKIQGKDYPVQGYAPDYQPPTPPRKSAQFEAGASAPRNSEMRIVESLRSAKEGRRGKVKSIQKYCNIEPGDTDEYEKWSVVWDNL